MKRLLKIQLLLLFAGTSLAGSTYELKSGGTTALTGSGESFSYGASVNAGQVTNVEDAGSPGYMAIVVDPNPVVIPPLPSGIFRSSFE